MLLTMSSKDSVTEAFELFDADNDGKILASEVGTAIRSLGHVVTDAELRKLFGKAGIDPRGKVDLGKFRQLVQPLQGINYTKQLEEAFNTIDKEGSGFIMATELRHLLTHMGDRISDEEFNALLEELEVDSNGRVRRKEFVQLLSR
ncbi:neo-calmodulin-like [Babylonia areolata]|uniref:neo-calmodulin-like n=1 Tax=Babylonia areolata TaxID=304850 RepID=UPI003FD38C61